MTAASQTTCKWEQTYVALPSEVTKARHDVGEAFSGCSRLDDLRLLVTELGSNSVTHSESRHDGKFTVRVTAEEDYIFIECEDAGGAWRPRETDDRPHGLDIVHILCADQGWGVDSFDTGRVVWARLNL
jgi:two-component sensor histidine kinase